MAKNYDPQKAHEYYMKRRKLKGRKKKGKKKKASKVTLKKLLEGLTGPAKEAALEAQARINVEKKTFNKQFNEMMKQKLKEMETEGMSDTDKAVLKEKLRLQYAEVKKQATQAFKDKLMAEVQGISAGNTETTSQS